MYVVRVVCVYVIVRVGRTSHEVFQLELLVFLHNVIVRCPCSPDHPQRCETREYPHIEARHSETV